jgi:hypothetical protein
MRARLVLACTAAALLAATPSVVAQDREFTLLSPNGGPDGVSEVGVSPDGSAVFFVTARAVPGSDDRDGHPRLYRWRRGELTLLSGSGPAHWVSRFRWRSSADGGHVLVETPDDLPGTGDTDGLTDVFLVDERGRARLLTGSRASEDGGRDVSLADASADLARVYVTTAEDLAGDDDGLRDGFVIADGEATLLTGSRAASAGGRDADLASVSADGSFVWWSTDEDVPGAGDTDGLLDVYRAEDGRAQLVTDSRLATEGGAPAHLRFAASHGGAFIWVTQEDVAGSGDDDGLVDAYRTTIAADVTLHEPLSGIRPPAIGGRPLADVHAVTSDARRIVFSTTEDIVGSGDSDGLLDVYASGGLCWRFCGTSLEPELLSSSEPRASGGRPAHFRDASPYLDEVLFVTDEDIARTGDDDGLTDGYRATGSSIELVTGSRSAAAGGAPVREFRGSGNGMFTYFGTDEDVPGTGDSDGLYDVFRRGRRAGEGVVLLTGGHPAADWARPVTDWGLPVQEPLVPSDDERFVFVTAESLVGEADLDFGADVYLSTPAPSRVDPPPPATGPPTSAADPPAPTPQPPVGPPTVAGSPPPDAARADTAAPVFTRAVHLRRGRLRFALSEPAVVTVTTTRSRSGRRVGERCRAPTRRTARAPTCVRSAVVGRLRHEARAGHNRVSFGRRLPPGRYRVTAVARDAAGNVSRPSRVRFRLRAAAG